MSRYSRGYKTQGGMVATLSVLVILVIAGLALLGARAVAVAAWMAATGG